MKRHDVASVSPFAMFDRIVVINLASRPDRRAEMQAQMRRVGLALGTAPVRLFEAVRPSDAGGFPTVGARGCFMSHLAVLREAAAAGVDRLLILEDDLDFAADIARRAPLALACAEARGWDLFYGGHEIEAAVVADGECAEVPPATGVRTTHCIGLRGAAIARAADYLDAMLKRPAGDPGGGPMHVDGAYSWFRRAHPRLRTLAALPALGHQRASRSDIHALRWFDRVVGVRGVVGRLRSFASGR